MQERDTGTRATLQHTARCIQRPLSLLLGMGPFVPILYEEAGRKCGVRYAERDDWRGAVSSSTTQQYTIQYHPCADVPTGLSELRVQRIAWQAGQGDINDQYASQGWTPAQVRQGPGERHVRFGTVKVNHFATNNRYEPLGDLLGNDHDYVGLSTLDRTSGCVELGSMATHMRQYGRSGKYVKTTCTSDSGAGESVLSYDCFPEIKAQRSSESGTTYASADGSTLQNKGRKTLEATRYAWNGSWRRSLNR